MEARIKQQANNDRDPKKPERNLSQQELLNLKNETHPLIRQREEREVVKVKAQDLLVEKPDSKKEKQREKNYEWAKPPASAVSRVREVILTYGGYFQHPFSTMSSEKIRFLHYPQVIMSIPIGAFALSLPTVNTFLPISPKISIAIIATYAATVLFSIYESIKAKKSALTLRGSLDVIQIISREERSFLTGESIQINDIIGEFHWNPQRRPENCDEDDKLLVLSTLLSFYQSFLDLSNRIRRDDPAVKCFKAFTITSDIVNDRYLNFGGELTTFTDNPFLEKLDHLASRLNLFMNKRYLQALSKKVKTSRVAWFTPQSISSDKANEYLIEQVELLEEAIENQRNLTTTPQS